MNRLLSHRPTAIKNLFNGTGVNLNNYDCIVCNNPIRYTSISFLDTYIFSKAQPTFRFVLIEENEHVALCSDTCEDLYRITPTLYIPYFRDDIR